MILCIKFTNPKRYSNFLLTESGTVLFPMIDKTLSSLLLMYELTESATFSKAPASTNP